MTFNQYKNSLLFNRSQMSKINEELFEEDEDQLSLLDTNCTSSKYQTNPFSHIKTSEDGWNLF